MARTAVGYSTTMYINQSLAFMSMFPLPSLLRAISPQSLILFILFLEEFFID